MHFLKLCKHLLKLTTLETLPTKKLRSLLWAIDTDVARNLRLPIEKADLVATVRASLWCRIGESAPKAALEALPVLCATAAVFAAATFCRRRRLRAAWVAKEALLTALQVSATLLIY